MTVATYNQPDFTASPQDATTYKTYIDAGFSVHNGIGGAFAPHESSAGSPLGPDMTVTVDAGIVRSGTSFTEKAQQTSGTITAPTTNPRKDLIVKDSTTGTIAIVTGAEAASPVDPAITDSQDLIGRITLQTSTTSITNSIIDDLRTYDRDKNASETIGGDKVLTGTLSIENDAAAILVLKDTNNILTSTTLRNYILGRDSNAASTWTVGRTSSSTDLEITNIVSNSDINLLTQGTGEVKINSKSLSIGADVTGWVRGNTVYVEEDVGADSVTFDVDAVIGAAWESVGPFGSGATNIWGADGTGMDEVVSGAKWVQIAIQSESVTTSTSASCVLHSRATGSTVGISIRTKTSDAFVSLPGSGATGATVRNVCHANIPLDSSRRFDLYLAATGTATVELTLRGFGI